MVLYIYTYNLIFIYEYNLKNEEKSKKWMQKYLINIIMCKLRVSMKHGVRILSNKVYLFIYLLKKELYVDFSILAE